MPEMMPGMAEAAVVLLRGIWPVQRERDPERQGWDHMFSTSYQIACMALVALGEAEETGWGAVPKAEPRLPDQLPFWEDIAVAVLWLAGQRNLLGYRRMGGSLPEPRAVGSGGFVVKRLDAPPPPVPNILGGPGSGPARAAEAVLPVLEALGLMEDGRWTAAAEAVHWRGSGGAWGLSFDTDPRFLAAVGEVARTIPDAQRAGVDRLMRIAKAEVAAGVDRSAAAVEEARLRWGPQARVLPPLTAEQVRASLPRLREHDLDLIFFRRWRLGRGWLDDGQTARALEIFHDRLAITMRKAVIARLYPAGFVWE